MELEKLITETRNSNTMDLDQLSIKDVVKIMNEEDKKVPLAIESEIDKITEVIEKTIQAFNKDGRLIYIGAGTSGRLGILDAAECVPTFGVESTMVQGLIAGGEEAMTVAIEGAEDSLILGEEDLKHIDLSSNDMVIGIAASGRTPYVIGGLDYANEIGASTASISCNKNSATSEHAQIAIEIDAGPEILTGSTRLKAGTSQKLVLNMISTGAMIGIGKVYKNLMVDVKPTNLKLIERSKKIIMEATGCSHDAASDYFERSEQDVKLAIVMLLTNSPKRESEEKLIKNAGFVRKCLI
ncbi:N-acetylmuramic acid 6-phosphate etherase [Vagococcus fessus]|uniref:N-acetylmuramic acid 6-phosphate etherase n=1 Tax=Vagococcus fessus TaxID=120370 RepID=A0A430A5A4_9ENTE|nr:N-acetylmuramic acid 6-phosphate etherase [Vagococcus fessus]RSU01993.1 N-acetylmuramic acid 6-phosphate etherase [Vagococcus fessus]